MDPRLCGAQREEKVLPHFKDVVVQKSDPYPGAASTTDGDGAIGAYIINSL